MQSAISVAYGYASVYIVSLLIIKKLPVISRVIIAFLVSILCNATGAQAFLTEIILSIILTYTYTRIAGATAGKSVAIGRLVCVFAMSLVIVEVFIGPSLRIAKELGRPG